MGNPTLVVKYRFDEETITFLQELKWWEFSPEQIDQAVLYLTSLDLETSKQALLDIKRK